jgi:hypothetical protein
MSGCRFEVDAQGLETKGTEELISCLLFSNFPSLLSSDSTLNLLL